MQRNCSQYRAVQAELRAMEKTDRESNGGEPVTRLINGERYFKTYGTGLPPEGTPIASIAWVPESVILDRDSLPTVNARD